MGVRSAASRSPGFESVLGSRRAWRRLTRRATAAYERDLAKLARRVAAARPPVLAATSRPLRGLGDAAVATLTLTLPGWELELVGVAANAAGGVSDVSAEVPRLTRTGRYGAFWWIEVSGEGEFLVLLGSQLRIYATGGGSPAASAPPLELAGTSR